MGIDRIGKGGGVPPVDVSGVGGPAGAPGVSGAGEGFHVERASATTAPDAVSLDRVRSGEVPISTWIDGRVDTATAHLVGVLPAEQLAFVKDHLRQQLATDPVLADLAKAATGVAPPAEE